MALKKVSEKQIDQAIQDLHELAYNLWHSWNPAAQRIFQELSPFFWEDTNHNAVEVMNWISGPELKGRLQNPDFFTRVAAVCKSLPRLHEAQEHLGRQARCITEACPCGIFQRRVRPA